MRVYLFSFFLVLSFFLNDLQAQTYVFGQLTGSPNMITTGWSTNGNATIGDTPGDVDNFLNELILTNAFNNQSGGIFYNTPLNLTICQKWTVEFEYRIWGGNAADGLAFCFLSVPPTGFVNGGGIGIPGTANGLKVVIDTYDNCGQGGTNPEIQIFNGIGYNECLPATPKIQNSFGSLNYLRNANYQPVKITYDNGVITVFVNNVPLLTTNFGINYTGYMGFTASTGGLYDQHSIRNVIIYTDQAQSNAGIDVTTCSNEAVSIGAAPDPNNIYSWTPATGLSSTTIANPIVSIPNTTGAPITQTYTVTTSLASAPGLCPTTDQIVVTIQPEYNVANTINSCSGQYVFNGQTLTQSGLYNDTLSTVHGCDSIVSLNLTIGATPNVNAGQDLTLCSFESGAIGAFTQPGLNYSWSPATGLSASNIANPTVQLSNVNTGWPIIQTYTLTVTDNTSPMGCSSTDQVDVTVLPSYQVLVTDTLCNGGPFVYSGQSYTQTGIYIDSSLTTTGCDSVITINISISQDPVFALNDTLICFGDQATVVPQSTFNNVNYAWLAQNTTIPIVSSSLNISPQQTVSYLVTAVDSFLCSHAENVTITVSPLPVMTLAANQTTLCAYDTLQLTATGAPNLNWSGPLAISNGNPSQMLILPLSGTYQVVGTSPEGCQDSTALSITVNPAPQLEITPDQGICPGFAAQFTVSGALNYVWNDAQLSGSSNTVTPAATTTYIVVGANQYNCLDSVQTTITVYPQPIADFNANPQILTSDNPTVNFTSNAQNAAISTWDFGDGTTVENGQYEFDYTYPFVEDQTYTVMLSVESAEGCTAESQVQIQIKGGIIYYVPNTFTPDGDELNNLFTPVFTSGFDPQNFHMTIFNRWGEPVFESYDPNAGWDGKIDIYTAPEGTYTYIIDFKTLNTDEMIRVSGHVLLMR
ncbi:MAG: gliding motility-associated C-terminal domain-containing protein [Crocinitomicaceae bacterium]|jgi:trimeric autotransporter adhesin|nr:gliding motility-associated C-terminal domain-containing protein [Crocinitomicaceae bacterium]